MVDDYALASQQPMQAALGENAGLRPTATNAGLKAMAATRLWLMKTFWIVSLKRLEQTAPEKFASSISTLWQVLRT